MLEFMEPWNLIEFFNWMLGPGFGELIVILCVMSVPFLLGVGVLQLSFTRGMMVHVLIARLSNRLLVYFYTGDGLKKYFTLPLGTSEYKYTDPMGIEYRWPIRREGIEREPNGVRSTHLHPLVPTNCTLDQLAQIFHDATKNELYDAETQATLINLLAHGDSALTEDKTNKLLTYAFIIGILIATAVLIYIVMYGITKMDMCSVTDTVKTVAATTTTMPPIR